MFCESRNVFCSRILWCYDCRRAVEKYVIVNASAQNEFFAIRSAAHLCQQKIEPYSRTQHTALRLLRIEIEWVLCDCVGKIITFLFFQRESPKNVCEIFPIFIVRIDNFTSEKEKGVSENE